jgi:hypothetical protein
MTSLTDINITDGSDQESRRQPALEAGYFNVDELDFEQLLSLAAEFASVINFYDLKNEINGNWGEIFNADEAVIMATILSLDVKDIESELSNELSINPYLYLNLLIGLSEKINFWLTRLKLCQHKSGEALSQNLSAIIVDNLASELHDAAVIISRDEGYTDKYGEIEYASFSREWGIIIDKSEVRFPLARSIYSPDSTPDYNQNHERIISQLKSSLHIYLHSISYLKTITPVYLQESLASQQHHPAVGLFIVFLQLFNKAQNKVNEFTQRHLDFYYQKVLKINNKQPMPESAYLKLSAMTGIEKTLIKKQTEFVAGKDIDLNDIIYTAEENILVTDAKVESLATLYLQKDKLISPESELGYVTRMKSTKLEIPEQETAENKWVSWPLFGAEKPGDKRVKVTDSSIGFYLASPLLYLKEGVRNIEINFQLDSLDKLSTDSAVKDLLQSRNDVEFMNNFGLVFSRYLLSSDLCLDGIQKNSIITKAKQVLCRAMSNEISSLLNQDCHDLFYKYFKKAFCVKLTTEHGWIEISDAMLAPYSKTVEINNMGLTLHASLSQDAEPITPYVESVHGHKLNTELPVLQCYVNPLTNFYPYSIFRNIVIDLLQINVDVKGVKNILSYNQHGQLDTSRPFQPFGPIPGLNSYLVFGSYELAKKPVTELKVNIEWGELPRCTGGFSEHYRAYGAEIANNSFKGEFTTLANSLWQPVESTVRDKINLFGSTESDHKLSSKQTLPVNSLEYNVPIDSSIAEDDFQYGLNSRRGFLKLSLVEPGLAFGHKAYAELLTKTLSTNFKLKKPAELPNTPYTPVINNITLDYKASSQIIRSAHDTEFNKQLKVIHMHPFGHEKIFPEVHEKPGYFLPQYKYQGNLFIGLSASNIAGSLSLFFHLTEDLEKSADTESPVFDWFYLSDNTWKILSSRRILADTTNGFLSPGKITLNIPDDINLKNTIMPEGYYWLRVSTNVDARLFNSLFTVTTHVVTVKRNNPVQNKAQYRQAEEYKWTPKYTIPGITKISQVSKLFDGSEEESDTNLKTRLSERLRHKNRAVSVWDYEHLILQKFPELYKVKCFPATSDTGDRVKPGEVLIVVVPDVQDVVTETCKKSMINADRLRKIKKYISKLASPFAEIKVRNPVYEQVQVRCTVKFHDEFIGGENINRLNRDITDYICPWNKGGYIAEFGWCIRQKDIESYIRGLDYVEYLTNVSMLHITVSREGKYKLFDTAKDCKDNEIEIRPLYPWSLAIPVRKHYIETMPIIKSIKEEVTGVNELEIGGTFIISGTRDYGEEK